MAVVYMVIIQQIRQGMEAFLVDNNGVASGTFGTFGINTVQHQDRFTKSSSMQGAIGIAWGGSYQFGVYGSL